MKNIKIHCNSGLPLNLEIKNKKQIELYIDDLNVFNNTNNSIKILALIEPEEIKPFTNDVINNKNKVDFILTHNEKILNLCDNSYLFEYGTTWIKNYNFPPKNFSISHLVGFKTWTEGHKLRQKIWYKQNKIKIPKKFYLSKMNNGIQNFVNAPILKELKNPLFDSQFHITIENVKKNNYFTEKIIDCFQTKTIPVYWGCKNIGNYFNIDGIIIVNNFENIIKIVNNLTEEDYFKRQIAIEINFELSKKFLNIEERISQKIKEIINENID